MRAAAILERMECGMMIAEIVDASFRCRWVNPRFARITGYAVDELVGRDPWFLHTGIAPEAEEVMKSKVLTRGSCRGIIQIGRADGGTRWVEVTAHASPDSTCKLVGMISDWDDELQARMRNLTRQQSRLFALLGNRVGTVRSASLLGITERTVRYHRDLILEKLGLESLADLFVY